MTNVNDSYVWEEGFREFFIFSRLHTFSYFTTLKYYFSTYHFCSKEETLKVKIVKTIKEATCANHTTK